MPPAQKGVAGAAATSANNVTTPTTLTPALPAHAVDDLLLCYTACRSATPTVACAGWTQLANVTGTNGRLALFGKIATSASETVPSVVWSGLTTGTSGTPVQAQCSVFTGTQLNVGALGTIENGAASATVAASGTGITTVADNALVLALSARLDDAGTWTPPSGFTEIGEAASTSGADMSFSWAYQVKATAGAVAPADFAIASGVSFASTGLLVALRSIVPVTYFGVVSLPITYGQTINGSRKTFSTLDLPVTFGAIVSGEASTPSVTYYGSVTTDWQFGALISGQRQTFGQTALVINASIVTAGIRVAKTLYGAVALPIAFGAVVSGSRKTLGQLFLPITFLKDIQGQRKTFGQIAAPFIFSKDVRGQRKTFGQTAFPITFSSTTSGFRVGLRLYGAVAMPITFGKDVKGQRRALGQITMPIIFVKDVKGVRKTFGQVAMPIAFTKDVKARRKTFGQIAAPFIFGAVTQGRKRTFSKVAFPIDFNIDVKTGRVGTYGRIAFPIVVGFETSGQLHFVGVVLNQAEMVYLGVEPVEAVYVGVEKVWPTFSPAKLSGLVIWFDAVDYTLGSWPNKGSGPAMSIVGTPVMTIGPAKNGLPVVRFKPNESRVRIAGTGIDLDYTCVYVGRMWGLSAGGRVVTAQYPPSNLLIGYWNFNEDVCYIEGFLTPDQRKAQTTNWHMYSLDGGGVTPNYKPRFFSNGVFLSGDHASTGGWKGTFAINGYAPTTVEETCECEIAEVVLYNRKLLDVDRQLVEAYLRDKWAI